MGDRGHCTPDEVARLLAAPAVTTDLPGGGVMIIRGGTVGLGWSRDEAVADWWQAFAELVTHEATDGTR